MNFSTIVILLFAYFQSTSSRTDEGPLINVTAVMEGEVLLPCNLSTNIEDDQPDMIMFYHNDTGTPIYTVDIRNRRRTHAIHSPSSSLEGRAKFLLKPKKTGLHMKNVWSSDNGIYRCRVDFKKSPTKNTRVLLTVLVPPDSVRIVDEIGAERSSTIGPYVIGQTLALTCIATGGTPPPKVTWRTDHKPMRGIEKVKNGEVTNTLTISSLERSNLHQSFICQAANDEKAVPVTAAVTIEMTLPPLTVKLIGLSGSISAGVGATVSCEVSGARPSPTITWWLDGRPLKASGEKSKDSGNVTVSTLLLTVTREDQGKYLSCRAETPELLHSPKEDGVKLKVQYVPTAVVTTDSQTNLEDTKEGDRIHFQCNINAIPEATSITWYYNDGLLWPNSSIDYIIGNRTLTLRSVSKASSGNYYCKARNIEGEGSSHPIEVRVKFAPVCRPQQRLLYGVAKNERVEVMCQVDAHPVKVYFHWKFQKAGERDQPMSEGNVTNNWTTSKLMYMPRSDDDYGNLICSASNAIGQQKEPCVYEIFPAGPPEGLKRCAVVNESLDSVEVRCAEGFDGGLAQSFIMEVFQTRGMKLKSNVTSKSASFTVRGLPSGLSLTIRLYAANAKGRSKMVELKASTLSNGGHNGRLDDIPRASELPSTMEFSQSFTAILGVIGGIMVVFTIIVVVMVVRKPQRHTPRQGLRQDDSSLQILKKDDSHNGPIESPQKRLGYILNNVSHLYARMGPKTPNHEGCMPPKSNNPSMESSITPMSSSHSCHHNEFSGMQTPQNQDPAIGDLPNLVQESQRLDQPDCLPPMASLSKMSVSSAHPNPAVIPPLNTQTLPHRKLSQKGSSCSHYARPVPDRCQTLSRRGSLYIDPYMPLAPPPPYNTLETPEMSAVVPLAGETVCITPNLPINGGMMSPHDIVPPKSFASSFSPDVEEEEKMESSV